MILVQFTIHSHIASRTEIFQHYDWPAVSTQVGQVTLRDTVRTVLERHLAVKHLLGLKRAGRQWTVGRIFRQLDNERKAGLFTGEFYMRCHTV